MIGPGHASAPPGTQIVVVNAVYPPEPVVSARIGRDVAHELTRHGYRLSVVCPKPSRPPESQYPAFPAEQEEPVGPGLSVRVHRPDSARRPDSTFAGRFLESASFGRASVRQVRRLAQRERVGVIYANTWPLLAQAMIAREAGRLGCPLVLHVQDLYPESLLSKLPGMIRAWARNALMPLDRWTARRAARVVLISPRMQAAYARSRRLPLERMAVVANYVDESPFLGPVSRGEAASRWQVDEGLFTFLYLGNVGPVAGVPTLIRAFHRARLPGSQLVIIGGGSRLGECKNLVRELAVEGVRFVQEPDVALVPQLQSLGDVYLLPVRRGAALSSVPSKLVSYLLSGRPILASVDAESDTAEVIQRAGCGWVEPPEDESRLAERMRSLRAQDRRELEAWGRRGRDFALSEFSRTHCLSRLCRVIEGCLPHPGNREKVKRWSAG